MPPSPLLEAVRREPTAVRGLDLEGSAQVLCNPADEVLQPLPFYFNHAMAIRLAGGVPVPVAAGLVPDPDRLAAAITSRTRAIVTISPNNPSGLVTPPAVLAEINGLCARHGLLHVSDEAYADFVHGPVPCSHGPRPMAWLAGGWATRRFPASSWGAWPRFRTRC